MEILLEKRNKTEHCRHKPKELRGEMFHSPGAGTKAIQKLACVAMLVCDGVRTDTETKGLETSIVCDIVQTSKYVIKNFYQSTSR